MTDGWLYLENEQTGGTTRIPDDPAVRVWHEARGWQVTDAPDESAPSVPSAPQIHPEDEDAPFVELVHPETEARHLFPNNPDALQGASEAGWVAPNKDGSIPKRAKRAAADPQTSAAPKAAASTSDRPDTATDTKE
jgi:hypothetical protein